jgi:very-short-patch-repair endonuclease
MTNFDADRIILELAAMQHGVVARWQLVERGVSPAMVDARARRGRLLRRCGRRVYCVPPLRGRFAEEVRAALTLGRPALVSHRTACVVQGLLRGEPVAPSSLHPAHRSGPQAQPTADDCPINVSIARGRPDPMPGVRIHRVRLSREEMTVCDGVPVTVPERTLLDSATQLSHRALEQALAEALRVRLVSEKSVLTLLARYPRRPGAARLRALLTADAEPACVRSGAEELFLQLVRRAELPPPRVNSRVLDTEVDFCWPALKLAVEIDGLRWHGDRFAQTQDRRRDARLVAAGYRVMRLTWADLRQRPEAVLVQVARALYHGGGK